MRRLQRYRHRKQVPLPSVHVPLDPSMSLVYGSGYSPASEFRHPSIRQPLLSFQRQSLPEQVSPACAEVL